MSITIKDIAKALNVSASTVSRALRGSHEINEETKRAIIEYSEKYNYRPNPIAKSLKANKSKALGIIVPEIANQFFSKAINGIEVIAYNKGYHVIITQSYDSFEREAINLDLLLSRRVDGLLISLSSQTSDFRHLIDLSEQKIPVVFFDRVPAGIPHHAVTVNNFKGAFDATMHLIEAGFRHIAHITFPASLSITKERLEGYKSALNTSGLEYDEQYVKFIDSGGMIQDEIQESIDQLLDLKNKPEAVFAASDRLTTGAVGALTNRGISIPSGMGLVGFTNLDVAEHLGGGLTSVVQPAFEMGQVATELLIRIIESKRPVVQQEARVFETKLYQRQSSVKYS